MSDEITYSAPPQSRNEAILAATLSGETYSDPPQSRIEDLLIQLKEAIEDGGGGSGGTTNYNLLTNKPSIEGVTLQGNHTIEEIGGVAATDLAAVATTGAYSDLSGTPTLATVATSGSYNDLTNKPTVDSTLSTTSTNAVQNAVVTTAIDAVRKRSCSYINNSAAGQWAKIADIEITATSTQHRSLVLLVTQSYMTPSVSASSNCNGILQAKFRTSSGAFDRGQLEWLVAESGVDTSNFVMVYKNNEGSCTVELWCRNPVNLTTFTFSVLSDANKASGEGTYWSLYSSTSGATDHDTGDGSIISTISTIVQPTANLTSMPTSTYVGNLSGYQSGYYMDGEGVVHINAVFSAQSAISGGTVICTLPTGYRPSQRVVMYGINITTRTMISIDMATNGQCAVYGTIASGDNFSFNGFYPVS